MLTILIFCLYCVVTNSEDNCDINYNTCAEESLSVYSKDSNLYFKLIDEALAKFVPCSQDNCECYSPVVDADLQPFEDGITSNMIQSMEGKGTKYQVINHKLYRQKDCLFPSRCAGIEHFIKPLLNKLPDIELVINCRDWPQINNFGKLLPVFSFSKTKDYADIMYPAWGFWEGGPAISLYPTGIGRWDNHRKSISKASENLPWQKKLNKAFFRGSRTSDERDSLILLSRKKNDLVDAQYTKNQAWKSPQDTLNAEPAKEVSFENHCKYKFLFNFRGVAASFRFKHLFLCKSLVFHVGDEWQEFFYNALKPWVHYVPIKSYPSEEELESIIVFFKKHDKLAQEIAERGYWFIWNHLRMDDLNCYWENLLLKYSNLIKHKVNLDKNLIMIN